MREASRTTPATLAEGASRPGLRILESLSADVAAAELYRPAAILPGHMPAQTAETMSIMIEDLA